MYHQQGQSLPGDRKYWALIAIVRCDGVMAVNIKIMVSCDVTPCSLAYIYIQRFRNYTFRVDA